MPQLRLVQHAERSPTKCVACGDSEGPFVDLSVQLPVYGWLYLCAANSKRPGCIAQIARYDGTLTEKRQLEIAEEYIAKLEGQLSAVRERLQDEKFVRLGEVAHLLRT